MDIVSYSCGYICVCAKIFFSKLIVFVPQFVPIHFRLLKGYRGSNEERNLTVVLL